MRKKGDNAMIALLNNIRINNITPQVECQLKQCFIEQTDLNYLWDALHLFAENNPVNMYNSQMMSRHSSPLITVIAMEDLPTGYCSSSTEIIEARNRKQSETRGLVYQLKSKIGARVILTMNIDIKDRLINSETGTISKISNITRVRFMKLIYSLMILKQVYNQRLSIYMNLMFPF